MKVKTIVMVCLFSILMGFTLAHASPIRLDYTINSVENDRYNYEFTMVLDNADGTWRSGQRFGAIRFGSQGGDQTSVPLTNFVFDQSDLPVGPFTATRSATQVSGPGLTGITQLWTPTAVGQSLSWSGTSDAFLEQGELYWRPHSTFGRSGGIQLQVANHLNPIPEPGTLALAGTGLLLMMAMTRRRVCLQ